MSNLQLRIISGVVLIVLALALTWAGGIAFRIFCAALSAAVLHEWLAMRPDLNRMVVQVTRAFLVVILAALLADLPRDWIFIAVGVSFLGTVVAGLVAGAGLWAAWGILYAAVPMISLALLRDFEPAGLPLIIFLFAVVWSTDTAAYFTGRAIGGPKLAPSISPGKTWSGAIGGLVGAGAAGIAVAYTAGGIKHLGAIVMIALVLSIVSQIGDLFESAVKRRHGVKDSGTLIPGHGGVMDRIDGLVFAAVLLFVLVAVLFSH